MAMAPEGVESHPAPRRALRSGSLTRERVDVDIEGRAQPLKAWVVSNTRYPASVAGELEDARIEYEATRQLIPPEEGPLPVLLDVAEQLIAAHDEGQPLERLTELVVELKKAVAVQRRPRWRARAVDFEAYVTRCLCILIPGLEEWEADMMDPDVRLGWLRELGYFRPNAVAAQEGGEPQRPPEPSPSSTGDEPEPVLDASIA